MSNYDALRVPVRASACHLQHHARRVVHQVHQRLLFSHNGQFQAGVARFVRTRYRVGDGGAADELAVARSRGGCIVIFTAAAAAASAAASAVCQRMLLHVTGGS